MPTFLNLVPEQHPLLFPRKRNSKGAIVNTSRTLLDEINGKRTERTVERNPQSIVGITIHQTACVFGKAQHQPTRHHRALGVPAHVVAFRDGVYAQPAPLLWFLYHGNDLNRSTLGLECEGHYPGLVDDPETPRREDLDTTWGGEPTPLTPEALDTFRAGLEHLVVEGRKLGCPIQFIWAHRQASESRRSDPGEELWRKVVLEFGVPALGLKTRVRDVFDDGRPIPASWDPSGTGPY